MFQPAARVFITSLQMMMDEESDTTGTTADEASNQPPHTPEPQSTAAQNRIVAKMDAIGQLDGGQQSETDDARPAQPEHAAAPSSSSGSASDLRASVADTLSSSAGAASNASGSSNPPITPHNSSVEDIVGNRVLMHLEEMNMTTMTTRCTTYPCTTTAASIPTKTLIG